MIAGINTEPILWRYLSEYHPDATVQNPAKTYGGALSACAFAALKPMLAMIVGRVKERPYTAMVTQMYTKDRTQTCTDCMSALPSPYSTRSALNHTQNANLPSRQLEHLAN